MDSLIKIIENNTIMATVISGVLVYVLSQLYMEYYMSPRKKYRELKEKIAYILTLYACYYSNPYNIDSDDCKKIKYDYDQASYEIRKIGAELSGYIGNVPKFRWIKRKRLNEVKACIIGISNGLFKMNNDSPIKDNKENVEIIKKKLKIK